MEEPVELIETVYVSFRRSELVCLAAQFLSYTQRHLTQGYFPERK